MIPIICLVQEGQIAAPLSEDLKSSMQQVAADSFGATPDVAWVEVKEGNGFTEAMPSTTSIVSMQATRALQQDERIAVMEAICDAWMSRTGCSINEIVAAVSDPAA